MSLRERLRACGERFNVGHEPIGDQGALEIAAAILEEVRRSYAVLSSFKMRANFVASKNGR
jgi:hypothetical protein